MESISLRNLLLPAHSHGRLRGQTIDDDADPKTFISPGRLRSLREERPLEHSHSSTDLRHDSGLALGEHDQGTVVGDEQQEGSPRKPRLNGGSIRPRPKRPRRRSTLEWINAGGVQRQEKLERVVEERMANVFFSLHMIGLDGKHNSNSIASTNVKCRSYIHIRDGTTYHGPNLQVTGLIALRSCYPTTEQHHNSILDTVAGFAAVAHAE